MNRVIFQRFFIDEVYFELWFMILYEHKHAVSNLRISILHFWLSFKGRKTDDWYFLVDFFFTLFYIFCIVFISKKGGYLCFWFKNSSLCFFKGFVGFFVWLSNSFWTYIGCNMHAISTSIQSCGFNAFQSNSAAFILFKCKSETEKTKLKLKFVDYSTYLKSTIKNR